MSAGAELASIHSADDMTEAAATCSGTPSYFAGEYYDWKGHSLSVIPDLTGLKPAFTATSSEIVFDDTGFAEIGNFHNRFAAKYTGDISIETSGKYTFKTTSDDGSRLWVGNTQVVNDDGLHGPETGSGEIFLESGYHPITVRFFENDGAAYLKAEYSGPDTGDADTNLQVQLEYNVCKRTSYQKICV